MLPSSRHRALLTPPPPEALIRRHLLLVQAPMISSRPQSEDARERQQHRFGIHVLRAWGGGGGLDARRATCRW